MSKLAFHQREAVVLTLLITITAALFAITHFVTRAYQRREDALARRWFSQAQQDLSAQRVDPAIAELRTALAYSKDNFQYRLALARALGAAGHLREARAYLRALWEQEPGNGMVNLELANLAAGQEQVQEALRYYHGAIYGLWNEYPAQNRRQARLELINFLLRHNLRAEAQSELIALSADVPAEPPLLVQVADLMLKASEPQRALGLYQRVLDIDKGNVAALAGAGQAAFELERYQEAQRYLQRAAARLPVNSPSAALLKVTNFVLELDPLQPRLSMQERARRLRRAADLVSDGLEQCALSSGESLDAALIESDLQRDYADLRTRTRQLSVRVLRSNPDLIDAMVRLFARAEGHLSQRCGALGADGRALLLIASKLQRGQL